MIFTARGRVAQLGERVVRNDEATGSIPVSSTKDHRAVFDGDLAMGLDGPASFLIMAMVIVLLIGSALVIVYLLRSSGRNASCSALPSPKGPRPVAESMNSCSTWVETQSDVGRQMRQP